MDAAPTSSASPSAVNAARSPAASSASRMGQQMTPDTAKLKCKNFLATLLRLASDKPAGVAQNVRTLIQGLIDGAIDPVVFTTKLQHELNSSRQPCLVPFLMKSLPYLQTSLRSGELSIEGVRAPSTIAAPQGPSMARTRQTARTSTGGLVPPTNPPHGSDSESESDQVSGQGKKSSGGVPVVTPWESESDQDSRDQNPRPARTRDLSELQQFRKEVRDEAIKETEAKYKRKVEETLQCVVCLHIPKEGHIIQCQNGHLLCEECTNNNMSKACPSCRAPLDQLAGNKRIRSLMAEQLIESMDLTFRCKHHPYCKFSGSKNEAIRHEKKCEYRMVPCPEAFCCCKKQWPLRDLLEHMKHGHEITQIDHTGYKVRLTLSVILYKKQNLGWDCKVLNYQDQLFARATHKVDGIFYTYVYILGDHEEAKKFKVAISIGQGTQTGIIHTGQIFPIDAKKEDIIKEKSGVLSFSPTGMGETLFEDVEENQKILSVDIKISNAE